MLIITLGLFLMMVGFALYRLFEDAPLDWAMPLVRICLFGGSAMIAVGALSELFHLTVG